MTDTAYLPIGGEVLVDLTANDIDPSGRALAVQQLTVDPNSGLVVTVSDMHLVRISARRAVPSGGLWFSYQVSSGGASATGWVTGGLGARARTTRWHRSPRRSGCRYGPATP